MPLDPAFYGYLVSCATEAQATGIKAAFSRAESLINIDDPSALFDLWDSSAASQNSNATGDNREYASIRVDGSKYQGVGDAQFQIQDTTGLIDINIAHRDVIRAQLRQLQVPESELQGYINKLEDYIDENDLHRLEGAEAPHYHQQEMLPPRNANLRTPQEINKILGWKKLSKHVNWHAFVENLTVHGEKTININAATRETLLANEKLSAEKIDEFMIRRDKKSISRFGEAAAILGNSLLIGGDYKLVPGKNFRITIGSNDEKIKQQFLLKMTPLENNAAPWEILWYNPSPNKSEITLQEQREKIEHVRKTAIPFFG